MARPTLKRPHTDDEDPPPRQIRRNEDRFLLKIDGQAKRSYADKEAAIKAGKEIKQKYPVVKAAVFDSKEGTNEVC